MKQKENMNKKGQVWVETVLYTLITITLIGIALAFISPRITEAQDRALVEQTLSSLNTIDEKINEALQTTGSIRIVYLSLKKGELTINSRDDTINVLLSDLTKPYSEPGVEVREGRVRMLTTKGIKASSISLSLNYSGQANISYKGEENVQRFDASSTLYSFSIENKGSVTGVPVINIAEISGK